MKITLLIVALAGLLSGCAKPRNYLVVYQAETGTGNALVSCGKLDETALMKVKGLIGTNFAILNIIKLDE